VPKSAFVRLVQPGIARLVIDTEGPEPIAEVHHCMANRRDLHAKKPADEQVSWGWAAGCHGAVAWTGLGG